MKKIVVVGAGTMGAGIAQVVADAGYDVVLGDISDGVRPARLRHHQRRA